VMKNSICEVAINRDSSGRRQKLTRNLVWNPSPPTLQWEIPRRWNRKPSRGQAWAAHQVFFSV
jgi:hypothetical protein